MYATIEDMALRFGDEALLDQALGTDGALNSGAVEAALVDASEVVDSHTSGRYMVPLFPVPAPVRRWCADIAWYYLHKFEPPKSVRQGYEDALAGLRDVAKGVTILQSAGVQAPAQSAGGTVQSAGPLRVFDAQSLGGF